MFAIAEITSGKGDRLGAVTISKTGDNKFFWIDDRDNCGAEIGDTVLIYFHSDDQFAQYIPMEAVKDVLLTDDFCLKNGLIVKKELDNQSEEA